MAQYEEQNPLDYRPGGDTVDDFAQKYMKEIARIYQFLNNLREHNSTGPNQVEPQPCQLKAENGKMYIRNTANSAWLYLFDIAYRMGMSDNPDAVILTTDDISSTGESLKLVKTDENGVANISISGSAAELDGHGVSYFVTTAEVAEVEPGTVTSEANKLVKTNANGVLPVNILGNCGKMAGYNIEVNNLSDGQVFTYRSASNSWRNEDKGVVGAGKALAMYDGSTLLFEYSGDAPQSFDTEKTSIKGDITTLQGDVTDIEGNLGSFLRQPSTAYALGTVVYLPSIGAGLYLECATAGTTDSGDLVISTPIPNDTVSDGTVVWTIKKIGSGGGVSIGIIEPFAGNGQIPEGFLECDGSAVSRTMFPDLFDAIGTTYGAGDGSTTFNLPDAYTAMRVFYASATAGTVVTEGLPNIEGNISSSGNTGFIKLDTYTHDGALIAGTTAGIDSLPASSAYSGSARLGFDASQSNAIYGASSHVQVNGITMRMLIKAFDGQTPDSALIDITQYANELAGKADRQLSNLDTSNLTCHLVVDSYYNSSTGDWYRVYDDGWVEQGGYITSVNNLVATVTLLKPYKDTNYIVSKDFNTTSSSPYTTGVDGQYFTAYNKTQTGFVTYCNVTTAIGNTWTAYGMGASV